MAASFDPVSEPYRDETEARSLLPRFVDRACGPDPGIAWVANGSLHPLRPSASPSGTFPGVAVLEWGPALPEATPPTGFLDRIERGSECGTGEEEYFEDEAAADRLGRWMHVHTVAVRG